MAFHSSVTVPAGCRGILKAHPHLPRDPRIPSWHLRLHSHDCHPSLVLQNERRCECKQGYVGDGIQCLEEAVPPTDRCLEDNGQCHREAICTDLHFHGECAQPCRARDDVPWRGHIPSSFTFGLELPSGELEGGMAKGTGTHLCSLAWFSHFPFPYMSYGEDEPSSSAPM